MTNDNFEDRNAQDAGENNDQPKPTHGHSIFGLKLDTDFPLSGGETEHDWEVVTGEENNNADDDDDNEEIVEEKEELRHMLDTDFPLSGGEI